MQHCTYGRQVHRIRLENSFKITESNHKAMFVLKQKGLCQTSHNWGVGEGKKKREHHDHHPPPIILWPSDEYSSNLMKSLNVQ